MPIEIREVVIKAQIEQHDDHNKPIESNKRLLEQLKADILKACLEQLEEKLNQRLFER